MEIAYIIPTLNEEAHLSGTLDSVIAQTGEKEIIVVDGGSHDETLEIALSYGCKTIVSSPGRGSQMNQGAAAATKTGLLFLHADTILHKEASDEIERILCRPGVLSGSFRLEFQPNSLPLRFYAFFSRINLPLFNFGDQGLFLLRSTFQAIGGFEEYPILEDVEIQQRLRSCGQFRKSHLPVVTSSRRFTKIGPISQQFLNALILTAYYGGASPITLAKLYSHVR